MHNIIDNALSQEEFDNIKNFMLNPGFTWNLTPVVTNEKENLPITASYYFTHEFWSGFHTEPQTQVFVPSGLYLVELNYSLDMPVGLIGTHSPPIPTGVVQSTVLLSLAS